MGFGIRVRGAEFKFCFSSVTLEESRMCNLLLQREELRPAFPAVGKS